MDFIESIMLIPVMPSGFIPGITPVFMLPSLFGIGGFFALLDGIGAFWAGVVIPGIA